MKGSVIVYPCGRIYEPRAWAGYDLAATWSASAIMLAVFFAALFLLTACNQDQAAAPKVREYTAEEKEYLAGAKALDSRPAAPGPQAPPAPWAAASGDDRPHACDRFMKKYHSAEATYGPGDPDPIARARWDRYMKRLGECLDGKPPYQDLDQVSKESK